MLRLLAFLPAAVTLGAPCAPAHARPQAAAPQSPAATRPRPQPAVNPLLARWTGPFAGVPPWDLVRPELFPAAFAAALAEERTEIAAIASSPQPATFDNTIAAMQRA